MPDESDRDEMDPLDFLKTIHVLPLKLDDFGRPLKVQPPPEENTTPATDAPPAAVN
jgi:hypothetical protein